MYLQKLLAATARRDRRRKAALASLIEINAKLFTTNYAAPAKLI
jgi:hypothetical protein